ncbi:unnamed protein product [Linum trigynum]|uniref:Uncharacterized protein n=1 Tax=Linum trigynum TaxID=586398 RepID=A0AAV2DBE9_9ROSI
MLEARSQTFRGRVSTCLFENGINMNRSDPPPTSRRCQMRDAIMSQPTSLLLNDVGSTTAHFPSQVLFVVAAVDRCLAIVKREWMDEWF